MSGDVFDNTVTTTTHMQYIKYNLRDGKYVLLSTQSYNFTVFSFAVVLPLIFYNKNIQRVTKMQRQSISIYFSITKIQQL